MADLIRRPSKKPETTFDSSTVQHAAATPAPVEEPKKKKRTLDSSVAVTKETRKELNVLRKIHSLNNVDDVIQHLIKKEYATMSEVEKIKYDTLKEFM